MRFLYSDILPPDPADGSQSITQCFEETLARADGVEIAVGYTAQSSLEELARLAERQGLRRILLLLGMYREDGMPRRLHECALRINEDWRRRGCGEIRIIMPMSYHGKVYCFYKHEVPIAAIMGSANLTFLCPDATHARHCETAAFHDEPAACQALAAHLRRLARTDLSADIAAVRDLRLYPDETGPDLPAHDTGRRLALVSDPRSCLRPDPSC